MTTKIKATNIWKKFNNLEVLKGIDLEVNEGEVVAVIGPSGGGQKHPAALPQQAGNNR